MNLSGLDLNLLRVLNAMLADASTVRTAARIGLSQSAVSAALSRLRLALKDPLFIRQGQHLVPTAFAQGLQGPLNALMQDLETLLSGPAGFDPMTTQSSIRIAGSDFFAEILMPKLAALIGQRAPGMQVQMVNLVPESYAAVLDRAEVDMALIPQGDFPEWIATQALFRSDFVMIARGGHPRLAGLAPGAVVPMDLFCDLGHVVFSPEGKLRAMGDASLARAGRKRRVVMTLPFFAGVINAVAASDLVGLVPRQLAQVQRFGLQAYRAPVTLSVAKICMAWHSRHNRAPAHAFARQLVAEILAPLDGPLTSP